MKRFLTLFLLAALPALGRAASPTSNVPISQMPVTIEALDDSYFPLIQPYPGRTTNDNFRISAANLFRGRSTIKVTNVIAGNIYVTNLYATNIYAFVTNYYASNFYTTNIFIGNTNFFDPTQFAYDPTTDNTVHIKDSAYLTNTLVFESLSAMGAFKTPGYQISITSTGTNVVNPFNNALNYMASTVTNGAYVQLTTGNGSGSHLWLVNVFTNTGFTLPSAPLSDDPSLATYVRGGAWTPTEVGESIELLGIQQGWIEIGRSNPNGPAPVTTQYWTTNIAGGVTNLQPVDLTLQPMINKPLAVGTNAISAHGAVTPGASLIAARNVTLGDPDYQESYLGINNGTSQVLDTTSGSTTGNWQHDFYTQTSDRLFDIGYRTSPNTLDFTAIGGTNGSIKTLWAFYPYSEVNQADQAYRLNWWGQTSDPTFMVLALQNRDARIFGVAPNSGYTGTGTKALMDNGIYDLVAQGEIASAVNFNALNQTNINIGNLTAGTNTVWVIPANKYAIIYRISASTTNSSTVGLKVLTNGVSYGFGNSVTVTTNALSTSSITGSTYVYEPGETIQVSTSANGVNVWFAIRYLDQTNSWIKPIKYFVQDTNTNLVYTVSSNKTAFDFRSNYTTPFTSGNTTLTYTADPGGATALFQTFIVAPGEFPDQTNRVSMTSVGSGATTQSLPPLPAGYSIYFSSSVATNGVKLYGGLIEISSTLTP